MPSACCVAPRSGRQSRSVAGARHRGGGPDGPVAVIGYNFWQRRFGGESNVVGLLTLVALGIVAGAAVGLRASPYVATLLFPLEPRDPATFIGSAIVLATIGALAGSIPAMRASRLDPAPVLRDS